MRSLQQAGEFARETSPEATGGPKRHDKTNQTPYLNERS